MCIASEAPGQISLDAANPRSRGQSIPHPLRNNPGRFQNGSSQVRGKLMPVGVPRLVSLGAANAESL